MQADKHAHTYTQSALLTLFLHGNTYWFTLRPDCWCCVYSQHEKSLLDSSKSHFDSSIFWRYYIWSKADTHTYAHTVYPLPSGVTHPHMRVCPPLTGNICFHGAPMWPLPLSLIFLFFLPCLSLSRALALLPSLSLLPAVFLSQSSSGAYLSCSLSLPLLFLFSYFFFSSAFLSSLLIFLPSFTTCFYSRSVLPNRTRYNDMKWQC